MQIVLQKSVFVRQETRLQQFVGDAFGSMPVCMHPDLAAHNSD
jgi:hypothetical protein